MESESREKVTSGAKVKFRGNEGVRMEEAKGSKAAEPSFFIRHVNMTEHTGPAKCNNYYTESVGRIHGALVVP